MQNAIIAFLMIGIVTAGIYFVFSGNNPSGKVVTPGVNQTTTSGAIKEDETNSNTSTPLIISDNAIFVADQEPGNEVIVNFIQLGVRGYVAIHTEGNKKTGDIIGYSLRLNAGRTDAVRVTLNKEVEEGDTLSAMLHADNGDGVFDPTTDPPVRDIQGNPLSMKFTVQKEAAADTTPISL